ncbi:MAG TPA: hypothetical protein VF516_14840 [Kofleriaceae bacterium]
MAAKTPAGAGGAIDEHRLVAPGDQDALAILAEHHGPPSAEAVGQHARRVGAVQRPQQDGPVGQSHHLVPIRAERRGARLVEVRAIGACIEHDGLAGPVGIPDLRGFPLVDHQDLRRVRAERHVARNPHICPLGPRDHDRGTGPVGSVHACAAIADGDQDALPIEAEHGLVEKRTFVDAAEHDRCPLAIGVPHARGTVARCRDDAHPVRAEVRGPDLGAVATEDDGGALAIRGPDPGRSVRGRGDDALTGAVELRREYRARVSSQKNPRLTATLRVEHPHRAVAACGDHLGAIRAETRALDPPVGVLADQPARVTDEERARHELIQQRARRVHATARLGRAVELGEHQRGGQRVILRHAARHRHQAGGPRRARGLRQVLRGFPGLRRAPQGVAAESYDDRHDRRGSRERDEPPAPCGRQARPDEALQRRRQAREQAGIQHLRLA